MTNGAAQPQHIIRIYRKGNGKAEVQLSPQPVRHNDVIRFWNISECDAEVTFRSGVVHQDSFQIKDRGYFDATVTLRPDPQGPPEYREYKVKLHCPHFRQREQYAEGGSDPGLFVDP